MKIINNFCRIIMIILLVGCSKEQTQSNIKDNQQKDYSLGIRADKIEIDAVDAILVAQRYCKSTKGTMERKIKNVVPIVGNMGKTDIYAVNFEENNGFILISATKGVIPILADIERGEYNSSIEETPASILINEFIDAVDDFWRRTQDVQKNTNIFWSSYEKEQHLLETKISSSLITSSIEQWEDEGYVVYDLMGGTPENLPNEVFSEWYDIAESFANSDYDFRTNSFILRLRETFVTQSGPFLTTRWNQESPYSNSIPTNGVTPNYLGCSVVALSQILNYYEWPQTIPWSVFPDTLPSNTSGCTPLSDFMYSVGTTLNIDYSSGDCGCSIEQVKNKLSNYYSYYCDLIQHNHTSVYNNGREGKVVYMRGHSNLDGSDHAWVCDGCISRNMRETYILKILSDFEPIEFISPCAPYQITEGSESFHMVLGTNGGSFDGWYTDILPAYLHNVNRKDIVNIQPRQ